MNSTLNFTTESTTNNSIGLMSSLALCVCSINFLFGLPIHFYVIRLIVTETGFATDFFNLNISVCEIGNCLKCLIDILSVWFSNLKTSSQSLQGLCITGRPLFQCLICVERYLAVVHPVTFLKYKPLRYRVICCTVAWIITLASCLFCMFIVISLNTSPHARLFTVQFVLFPFVQLFFLVAVLTGLKQTGPGDNDKEKANQMKRRAFNHILITTVAVVVIFVSYKISAFILTQQHISALQFIASVGYLLDGFLQPVLFLRRTGKITCSSLYKCH